MIQIINNEITQIELPQSGYLKNGKSVSGYNLLPIDILKEEGWLTLRQEILEYNTETQYLQHNEYIIGIDEVIETFIVVNIEGET
jgi:hypothetical protein